MSNKASKWAWDQYDVTGAELLVLLALADHAWPDGTHCFPSVSTLAKQARMSTRSVQRHLQTLESRGYLRADRRPGRVTSFTLAMDRDQPPGDGRTPDNLSGVNGADTPDNLSGVGGDNLSGVTPDNLSGRGDTAVSGGGDRAVSPDPILNRNITKTRASARGAPARKPGARSETSLLALNNSAALLGIYPKTENESIDAFRERINRAHKRKLDAQAAGRTATEAPA